MKLTNTFHGLPTTIAMCKAVIQSQGIAQLGPSLGMPEWGTLTLPDSELRAS